MDVDMVDGGEDAFQKLLAIWTDQEVVEAQRFHFENMRIVSSLGGHGGAYKRERSSSLRAVVSELSLSPHVSAAASLMPNISACQGSHLLERRRSFCAGVSQHH